MDYIILSYFVPAMLIICVIIRIIKLLIARRRHEPLTGHFVVLGIYTGIWILCYGFIEPSTGIDFKTFSEVFGK